MDDIAFDFIICFQIIILAVVLVIILIMKTSITTKMVALYIEITSILICIILDYKLCLDIRSKQQWKSQR